MKILGALLIILSCSCIGFLGGQKIAARLKQLQKLRRDLTLLEMDINYAATPLPEALARLASLSEWPISFLWQETCAHLGNGEGLTAEEAWYKALKKFSSLTALTENDLAVIRDFGAGLGTANRQEQMKKFKLLQGQLSSLENQAEEIKQKHERMWRTMGVLTGIALVILLF